MAPSLLLRLRALFVSCCFRSVPAPAPALEDHDIFPEIGSAPALEDDDILREIMIRLSPLPSSLLRATLVCKRWRSILSDPAFLRRFRAHHRTTPPLLGFFDMDRPAFTPLLHAPNRIPSDRFPLPVQPRDDLTLLVISVRHGLVLLLDRRRLEAIVWDPVTGRHHTVPYTPEFRGVHEDDNTNQGGVLRSAAADDGVCFKVVLTRTEMRSHGHTTVFMAIYDSATHEWSKTSSTTISSFPTILTNVLVGNALCGFLRWSTGILEFDLGTNTVGVIQTPAESIHPDDHSFFHVVRTQDGGLGLATLSAAIIQLWARRTTHGNADAEWVLQTSVDLDKLIFWQLPTATPSPRQWCFPRIVGYDEDNNVVHVAVNTIGFTVNLATLQYTKVLDEEHWIGAYYPYTGFYALGASCEGGPTSFACQNEETASWCNLFSRCKRTKF